MPKETLKIIGGVVIAVAGLTIAWLAFFHPSTSLKTSSSTPLPTATSLPNPTPQVSTNAKINSMHLVTLKTSMGDIQFETYDSDAPNTVKNFLTLAQESFYNNLIFHRVVKGFVIQGGDPNCSPASELSPAAAKARTNGPCGTGGPGYPFADELNPNTPSYQAGYLQGVVAMANSGPNTNGSQFFIMLQNYPLQHLYTIFGKVVKGQDVVNAIGNVAVDANDRPLSPVIIKSAIVESK